MHHFDFAPWSLNACSTYWNVEMEIPVDHSSCFLLFLKTPYNNSDWIMGEQAPRTKNSANFGQINQFYNIKCVLIIVIWKHSYECTTTTMGKMCHYFFIWKVQSIDRRVKPPYEWCGWVWVHCAVALTKTDCDVSCKGRRKNENKMQYDKHLPVLCVVCTTLALSFVPLFVFVLFSLLMCVFFPSFLNLFLSSHVAQTNGVSYTANAKAQKNWEKRDTTERKK